MKYSLLSLMIVVMVVPPLLAWGALPIYRWLTTPQPLITEVGHFDRRMKEPPDFQNACEFSLPNSSAPAPNPPKP